MQINDLAYVKACKAAAQLRAVADEAVDTFIESDVRRFASQIVANIAARYGSAIAESGARKPAIFIVNDDVDYARRNWVGR